MDEIELLTLLIEKWDEGHNTFEQSDPIELVKYLMAENNIKAKDLAEILNVSKGLVSDILKQEAYNRHYELKADSKSEIKNVL